MKEVPRLIRSKDDGFAATSACSARLFGCPGTSAGEPAGTRINSRLRSLRRILTPSPLRLLGITGDRECCAPAYSRGKHRAPISTLVVRHSTGRIWTPRLRPAKVGETLITTTFRGAATRGFAAEAQPEVAVCLLPGTELAFVDAVGYDDNWGWRKSTGVKVARFRKVEPDASYRHHDALEFPDGTTVLVTQLRKGQRATVLQLPIGAQVSERSPKAATFAEAHEPAPASAV